MYESRRFRESSRKLLRTNLRYVLQQAISSPLIEMLGAVMIVGLLWYARNQIKAGGLTPTDFATFRRGPDAALAAGQAAGGNPQHF